MHEQASFLDELASFCDGVSFTFVSAKEGLVCVDLGQAIREYNETTNNQAKVTYRRYLEKPVGEHTAVQNVAGMLGCFGNINTCTVAHAAIIGQLYEDPDHGNVAGDDGLVPENEELQEMTNEAINLIGIHEETKEFLGTERGAIHLKRPFHFDTASRKPSIGFMVIWPNISLVEEVLYGHPDPRYTDRIPESKEERVKLLGSELYRFLRSIHKAISIVDEDDLGAALAYSHKYTSEAERVFGIKELGHGQMTQLGSRYFWPALPDTVSDMKDHPLIRTVSRLYCGSAVVPETGIIPFEEEHLDSLRSPGSSIICNSHPHLRFLSDCGYVQRDEIRKRIYGSDGFEYLCRENLFLMPSVYQFTIVSVVPEHLIFLVG